MNNGLTRRQFLTAATTLAVAASNARRTLAVASPEISPHLPENIRVGIIGLDGHYSEITNAAKVLPNIRITAIAETDSGALQSASRNPVLAAAKTWTDYRAMLAAEKLDIVCVCGQNGVRARTLQACAERGVAIVTEKPLALNLSELETVKR